MEHGSPKPVSAESGEDLGVRLLRENDVEVLGSDPVHANRLPILFLRHVRFGLKDPGGFDDGLFKRQMLEGVQGVVVDKNADRALGRQKVSQVV